jgi:hypothetical protein
MGCRAMSGEKPDGYRNCVTVEESHVTATGTILRLPVSIRCKLHRFPRLNPEAMIM